MKFSDALKKYAADDVVKELDRARLACRDAGAYNEEFSILVRLVNRLKELSGKPIVVGV
jgi:hypothetical protein